MDVNRNAPVAVELEVVTRAAPTLLWNLHTDIDHWSEITSTIGAPVPQRCVACGGRAPAVDGLHPWTFTPQPEGVLVPAEESWDSEPPVGADPTNLRTALEAPLRHRLGALRKTAGADNLPDGGSA